MIVRLFLAASVLAAVVVLGMPSVSGDGLATASAAPAETATNGIQFSTAVTSDGRPVDPRTEFPAGTNTVWASFDYSGHTPGARVSVLVRANGDDFRSGDLDCCNGTQGRFAFPIERRNGGDLPGAAYDVRVYVNDVEVAQGGFGVRGRQGLDNDGQGDNGNDND